MKAPLAVARRIVANLDDEDRRTLTKEITGKAPAPAPFRTMRMCKYCGGMIHGKGVGLRGVYCQQSCWSAAEGFDATLQFEANFEGKRSFDQLNNKAEKKADQQSDILDKNADKFNKPQGPTQTFPRIDEDNITDRGNSIEAIYDRLDGTEADGKPKLDLAEILHKAKEIHPLLPSIIALLADGATQMQIARKLKVSQSVISEAIKALRASYGY